MNPNEFGSASAGSPATGSASAGSPIDQEQYKNLESIVGKQGQELGEYRKFFDEVAPLLEKLDKNPDLVTAIIDGKVDSNLVKAAMEGKITIGEAQVISKANAEVKKDLGNKE